MVRSFLSDFLISVLEAGKNHRRNNFRSDTYLSKMKFDDIIAEIGEFGPYQKRMYYLACLISIPSAMQTLCTVFTLATPDHRCALPDLPNDTYKSQGLWHDSLVKQSTPWDEDEEDYSYCKLFTKNYTTSESSNDSYSCSSWVFSEEFFENTFTREIEMICHDKSLSTYINMIYMGGLLAGSLILGTLSDIIGRKKVVLIGVAGQFSSSLAVAFVTGYVPFAILRFTTAFFGVGMMLAAFVIGMEIAGPSKRTFTGIFMEFFWCIGLFLLVFLAYFIRDWKYLQIATAVPTVFLLSLAFLLPESPRWLVNRGRYEEAAKIIQDAAKRNGVKLSDHFQNLDKMETEESEEKIWDMFKTPILLIRCLVIFTIWMVSSFVYYGLSLNVGELSGNIYLNFTLSSLVETVGYFFALCLLERVGRKLMQCFTMLLAGIACLATMFPVMYGSDSVEWVTITLSLVGKFGASASFGITYVYSAELFPTTMRNAGVGISSFCGRISGIIAPYIANLSRVVSGNMGIALPLIIFGGTSVVAGLLALLLPETSGHILPENVEDAKNFGRKPKKTAYHLDHRAVNGKEKIGNVNPTYSPDIM